jgi:hypothetical protein
MDLEETEARKDCAGEGQQIDYDIATLLGVSGQ